MFYNIGQFNTDLFYSSEGYLYTKGHIDYNKKLIKGNTKEVIIAS